jgi:hypothetical protein
MRSFVPSLFGYVHVLAYFLQHYEQPTLFCLRTSRLLQEETEEHHGNLSVYSAVSANIRTRYHPTEIQTGYNFSQSDKWLNQLQYQHYSISNAVFFLILLLLVFGLYVICFTVVFVFKVIANVYYSDSSNFNLKLLLCSLFTLYKDTVTDCTFVTFMDSSTGPCYIHFSRNVLADPSGRAV